MRYIKPEIKTIEIKAEDIIMTSDQLTTIVGPNGRKATYLGSTSGVDVFEQGSN